MICTRPRNPQGNGGAESKVKIIKAHLKREKLNYAPTDQQGRAWARMLPAAQRAYNEARDLCE